jgi:formylmethanofuran dehydrogenase subunit C
MHQKEIAGFFISLLIYGSEDSTFKIFAKDTPYDIEFLTLAAYDDKQNAKKLTIDAPANLYCMGSTMPKNQIIEINGDVNSKNDGMEMGFIHWLCEGNIVVNGNVDGALGGNFDPNSIERIDHSKSNIEVNGDVFGSVGKLRNGGSIVINGNVSQYRSGRKPFEDNETVVGHNMLSGEITINGNVDAVVGRKMSGGTININGNILKLGHGITGGNIFQRGRQLVEDGKKIASIENI